MENLYELLEEAAHKVPTKGIVIVNNSQCDLFLTYSELREKSRKIAFILKSYYQVKPVSKIIISVEKSENFILLFWGCVMAGCIPVLMPSVQFSNKNSIAFERLKNAIDILGVVTLITNGKTDKKQLPNIANQKQNFVKRDIVGPRNEREKQITLIWEKVLGIPEVGVFDNFWDIGGDSIRSVRLIKELKEVGLTNIKLKDLFDKPTIAELLEQEIENNKVENLICMKKVSTPYAKLICLPYAAGTPGMYSTFSGDFTGEINLYTVQYPGHGDGREIKSSVEEVGALLANELKEADKEIPLFIMGYSYSCYIAYDICKRFEQENIPIQGIIMIGGTPPTLRDDLMQFFSNDDNALLDYSRAKDLLNEELIATLSDEEKHEYLHELRMNTVAMVNYKFLDCKLKTPLCSIVGREDEPTIRNNQHLWNNYFQKVSFHQLPGGHVLITKYHAELAKLIMNYIELHV